MIQPELNGRPQNRTNNNVNVDGAYSPVSLKKYLELDSEKESTGYSFRVLIDNTGYGIALDDPNTMYMTPEDRIEQAKYFRERIFDGKSLPVYLFRYLRYMFLEKDDNKYPSDESVVKAYRSGKLTLDSPDYKMVVNLVKFSDNNVEAAHIIGLIQLVAGSFNLSSKEKRSFRLFIQHPETGLHPKRVARFMSMYHMIVREYCTDSPLD